MALSGTTAWGASGSRPFQYVAATGERIWEDWGKRMSTLSGCRHHDRAFNRARRRGCRTELSGRVRR
ncbi:MAG: hypothetical protein AVDCRST_MAG18-2366 [uncultured Thermomicrobiales bacterium]|uniref:Uncharacterized protein n=1 Tax=uncultured Thermomicrobiales bacterium TaxID=1645740 RepID=A0A6J4VDP0_9BACT|nr:MAG: hypothetical protein AVDCRST_MAG18-2366 [uncultured Thermomicrobiales bacterium]